MSITNYSICSHLTSRIFSTLIGLFFVIPGLSAQQTIIDSLNIVLSQTKEDTSRIKIINHIAFETQKDNPDSAFQILRQVLPEAEALESPPLLIELYYTIGLIYSQREQFDSTILVMEQIKSMASEIKDYRHLAYAQDEIGKAYYGMGQEELAIKNLKEGLATTQKHQLDFGEYKSANNLGDIYREFGQTDSAEVYLKKALANRVRLGDKEEEAKVLTNLAINAARAQQYEKAYDYFDQSLSKMKEVGNLRALCIIYQCLGETYFFVGDYPNAIDNYQKALNAVEGTQHYAFIISSFDYLSQTYLTMEDFDNALLYLERASKSWEEAYGKKDNSELSFKKGKVLLLKKEYQAAKEVLLESWQLKKKAKQFIDENLYWSLGQSYEQLSQIDSALLYYQNAVEIATRADNGLVHAQSLTSIADIYYFQQGKTQQAQKLYRDAYNLSNKRELRERQMEAAKGLYFTNKEQNDYQKALKYLEVTKAIQDSLFNEKNTQEITQMRADFEFEKEKQQLAFKQEKKLEEEANKRNVLWLALAAVGLVLLIGASYFRTNQKANKKLQKLNEEISEQKSVVEFQANQLSQSLEELQQKNELITQTQKQLVQQEKLASLGQLTAGISHEIKNPLNFINNFSEDSSELVDELEEQLKMITPQFPLAQQKSIQSILKDLKLNINDVLKSGSRLDQIVNNMMNHTRNTQNVKRLEDINKLVDININFAFKAFKASNIRYSTEIIKDFTPDLPHSEVYAQELGRVILNLVNNACYATFSKSKSNPDYFPKIRISTRLEKEQLKIIIWDNGTGIPENLHENIFNPFFTTKPTGEGNTGLGLSISYDIIVNLHKGQLMVNSELGKYTEFIILISKN